MWKLTRNISESLAKHISKHIAKNLVSVWLFGSGWPGKEQVVSVYIRMYFPGLQSSRLLQPSSELAHCIEHVTSLPAVGAWCTVDLTPVCCTSWNTMFALLIQSFPLLHKCKALLWKTRTFNIFLLSFLSN